MNKNTISLKDDIPFINSFEELASLRWPVKDVFWQWDLISNIKKSPEQIDWITTVSKSIKNYFQKKWIEIILPNIEKYVCAGWLWPYAGVYMPNINLIFVRSVIDIPVTVHETLHYISTQTKYLEWEYGKHSREYKSWFSSLWNTEDGQYRLFTWLNEWVTEKMREICEQSNIAYDKITTTDEQQREYDNYTKEMYEKLLAGYDKEYMTSNDYSNILMKVLDSAYDKFNSAKRSAYDSNIQILNNIILAVWLYRYRHKPDISAEVHCSNVWLEIAQHYIKGDILRLREREKIFWKWFLTKLAFVPESKSLDDDFIKTEDIVEKTVANVISALQNK